MLPPRVAKLRVVFISAIYSASLDAANLVMVYYVSSPVSFLHAIAECVDGYVDACNCFKTTDLVSSNQRSICALVWLPYTPVAGREHSIQLFHRNASRKAWLLSSIHDIRLSSINRWNRTSHHFDVKIACRKVGSLPSSRRYRRRKWWAVTVDCCARCLGQRRRTTWLCSCAFVRISKSYSCSSHCASGLWEHVDIWPQATRSKC